MTYKRRQTIMWLKFALFVTAIFLIFSAEGSLGSVNDTIAKDVVNSQISLNDTMPNQKAPIVPINSTIFIGIVLFVIASIVILIAYDMFETYKLERTRLNILKTYISENSIDKNHDAMRRLWQKPDLEGTKGLARTAMALAIIFIVGLALSYSVVTSGFAPEGVNNLASIFAGTVATIIGFYFGTRASEEGSASRDKAEKERSSKGDSESVGKVDHGARDANNDPSNGGGAKPVGNVGNGEIGANNDQSKNGGSRPVSNVDNGVGDANNDQFKNDGAKPVSNVDNGVGDANNDQFKNGGAKPVSNVDNGVGDANTNPLNSIAVAILSSGILFWIKDNKSNEYSTFKAGFKALVSVIGDLSDALEGGNLDNANVANIINELNSPSISKFINMVIQPSGSKHSDNVGIEVRDANTNPLNNIPILLLSSGLLFWVNNNTSDKYSTFKAGLKDLVNVFTNLSNALEDDCIDAAEVDGILKELKSPSINKFMNMISQRACEGLIPPHVITGPG